MAPYSHLEAFMVLYGPYGPLCPLMALMAPCSLREGQVDLLTIFVNGWELDVLLGARGTLEAGLIGCFMVSTAYRSSRWALKGLITPLTAL